MPDRFAVLKLLWNNLQYMKEKGESPDSTYDFLGANDLVTFLFNEDERYVKLLMLTLEMGRWSEVETLDPRFMGLYDGFFSEWSGAKSPNVKASKTVKTQLKSPTKSQEKKQSKVKKVEAQVEEVEETVEETVEEKVEETVEDEKSDIELASDSDSDSEILSESDDENELETFYDEYVLEVDNNEKKVELSILLEKYNSYCETNNMEKDEEGLETFLVEKLGKPKGKKKPKFVGVELKA
jgi:hypothetical protein